MADKPVNQPAGAGSALASAWYEFVSRAMQAGGAKAGAAMLQALAPAASDGQAPGSIEALVSMYRQYLGEMSNLLPVVARYITGQMKPVSGTVSRLLFRIHTKDPLVSMVEQRTAEQAAVEGEAFVLYASERCMAEVRKALNAGLSTGHAPIADLLEKVQKQVQCPGGLEPAVLLDELKYEFRRRGISALPDIRSELHALLDPQYGHCWEALEVLKRVLGEKVLRRIIAEHVLPQFGHAIGHTDKWSDQAQYWIQETTLAALQERFQAAGIKLSDCISVLAGRHEAIIFDHEHDDTYEVKYSIDYYDIYGERESRRFKFSDAKGAREALIPIRVMDSSQGFVAWSVDKGFIQGELDAQGTRLEAWDIGGGRTLVMLYLGDHREGDLEAYRELMLGCLATPVGEPLAVGLWMLAEVPVTTPLAQLASQSIWGFNKTLADITLRYRSRSVTCEWRDPKAASGAEPLISLTLPRGGEGVSSSLPLLFYSMKQLPGMSPALHRTLVIRSGSGEQMRGGGTGVSLNVTGTGKLCDMFRYLRLIDDTGKMARAPLFTAWSERVSGEASAPALLTVQTDGG